MLTQPGDFRNMGMLNRSSLALHRFGIFCLIDDSITGVDFRNIMNQQDFNDMRDIDWFRRFIGEQNSEHADLPTMFSRVFITITAKWLGLAQNRFKFVWFDDEVKNLLNV